MQQTQINMNTQTSNRDLAVAERLRNVRRNKGLLQKKVAEAVNMQSYTLQAIESGKRRLSYDELVVLCDYYNVPIDMIIKNEEELPTDQIFINAFNSLNSENQKDVLEYIEFKQTQSFKGND